ncbi:MAG: leucine-rich repeat domain-containing protein, partial [Saprospiraceae bacterium]
MNNRILPLYLFLICSTSLVANSITSDWSNLNHSFNAPFTSTYSNLSAPPPSCEGEYFYHVAPIWKDNDKYTPNNPYISTIYDRTEVTITNATGLIQIDTFVTSGAVLPISFDQVLSNDINAVKGDVGLIIKTSTPVNIRFSIEKNTYGIITAFKGKEALGTAFSVATQTGTTADFSKDQLHFASVIATEDNTTVTFDNDGDDFRGLGTSSFMVTLDAGETYMVLPDEDDNERFEGLSIISNKPIAVNSGESHVSQGGLNAEGGVVQVLPIAKVGKEYILSRASGTANSGDFALVLALADDTDIYLNGMGSPVEDLDDGEVYQVDLSGSAGTPYYISSNKDVYVYHYSSETGKEVGLAIPPPIDKVLGSKYIKFPRIDMDSNAAYVVIKNAGLSSLTLNGQPYTTFSTATTVTGKSNYSIVYFDDVDIISGDNIVESDVPFYFAQLTFETIFATLGGGGFDYLNDYNGVIEVVDASNPISYSDFYVADTIKNGASTTHTLTIESLLGGNSIQSVLATNGIISFSGNDLTYTAPTDFCGCDLVDVTVQDGSSRTKTVTVGFKIDDKPVAVDDRITNTGLFQTLDVLGNGDADPISCDTIRIVSVGLDGVNGLSALSGGLSINNNGTPDDYSDDLINYSPPSASLDSFQYVISDLGGNLDTAWVIMSVCDPTTDSLALVDLYNNNGGVSWNYTASSHFHGANIYGGSLTINIANAGTAWNFAQPISTWHGVTTNSSGCVTRLELISNNLTGTMPDINLPSLEEIFIRDNNAFAGNPFPNFTKTPLLEVYSIIDNGFSGNLPNLQLGELILLELDLEDARTIPDFTGLPNLQELRILNGKVSNLPDFTNTPNLEHLILRFNEIQGSVPDFTNLPQLKVLNLRNNKITGSLPDFSDNTPNLITIRIQKNQLTFEDLESSFVANNGLISSFSRSPQASVGNNATASVDLGSNYTINLSIDGGVTTSTYQWYLNGNPLTTTTTNKLAINNITAADTGTYTVEITNSVVTGLTLNGPTVQINLNAPPTEICGNSIDDDNDGDIDCEDSDCGPVLSTVAITDVTACGASDGIINITATLGSGTYEYSIDSGSTWQSSSSFTNLASHSYNVGIRNSDNTCELFDANTAVVIAPASIFIHSVDSTDASCGANDGGITINASFENENCECSGNSLVGYTILYSGNDNETITIKNNGNNTLGTITNVNNGNILRINASDYSISEWSTIGLQVGTGTTETFESDCWNLNSSPIVGTTKGAFKVLGHIDGANNFCGSELNYSTNCTNDKTEVTVRYWGPDVSSISIRNSAHTTVGSISNVKTGDILHIVASDFGLSDFGDHVHFDTPTVDGRIDLKCSKNILGHLIRDEFFLLSYLDENGNYSEAVTSSELIEYSIDNGATSQVGNSFMNLSGGNYNIVTLLGGITCQTAYSNNPKVVAQAASPVITDVEETEPTCGASDGKLKVNIVGSPGDFHYSIDSGVTWQNSKNFNNIPAGTYNIVIRDTGNHSCTTFYTNNPIILTGSDFPVINTVTLTAIPTCSNNDGIITITTSNTGTWEYSLDGTNWQTNNVFNNLGAGSYQARVRNSVETACMVTDAISYDFEDLTPTIQTVTPSNTTNCGTTDGSIVIVASDGSGSYEYSIDNGTTWSVNNTFSNLNSGNYDVLVRNGNGSCIKTYTNNPVTIIKNTTADSLQLVDLYIAANGSSWSYGTGTYNYQTHFYGNGTNTISNVGNNWLTGQPFASWHGVKVNEDGCVDTLTLVNMGMGGSLPNLDLPQLKQLILNNNNLNGSLPNLPNLPNLEHLSLQNNDLQNGIPNFTNLPKLTLLELDENQFTGLPDFTGLPSLIEFDIDNNNIGGLVPDFSNMPLLKAMDLDRNAFTDVPDFSNLSDLEILNLERNNLIGNLPDYSDNLTKLKKLLIDQNELTFEDFIPNYINNRNLIEGNKSIAEDTFRVAPQSNFGVNDTTLVAVGEGHTINLGIDAGVTTNTYAWYLNGSFLQNTTTNQLTLSNITAADTGNYTVVVTNSIVTELTLSGAVYRVRFNPIEICGNSLDDDGNGLTDCEDSQCGPTLLTLTATDESSCVASDGTITITAINGSGSYEYSIDSGTTWQASNSFIGLTGGTYYTFVRNADGTCPIGIITNPVTLQSTSPNIISHTTTDVSDCGSTDGTVTMTVTSGSGSYEYSIDNGMTWQTSNSFIGLADGSYELMARNSDNTCPVTYANNPVVVSVDNTSDSLVLVDLYNNNNGTNWTYTTASFFLHGVNTPTPNLGNPWLVGSIDTWHGVGTNANGCVNLIALENNNLSGTLANLNLPSLETLHLDYNNLSGDLPDFSTTPLLKQLSLGNNNFTGAIPNYNLALIKILNLEHNALSDMIPNFDGMPNLEYFDVDFNQLTGNLPVLASLTHLEKLIVDNNDLSGVIPDYSLTMPFLNELELHDNDFTFEDFLPNFSALNTHIANNFIAGTDGYNYNVQDKVGSLADTMITVYNSSITLNLGIDDTVTTNSYQWYKDGNLVATTTEPMLTLTNYSVSDNGVYRAEVTNSVIPDLGLESNNFTLMLAAGEICGNNVDDDGDGLIDSLDPDCPANDIDLDCNNLYTYYLSSVWRDNDFDTPRYLHLSTDYPTANVNVRTASNSINGNTVVTSAGETIIDITYLTGAPILSNALNASENSKGFIITSDVPILAYFALENAENGMIIIAKGKEALGQSFRVATQTLTYISSADERLHFASIIATENNTNITFDNGTKNIKGLNSPTQSITLNKGETYMIQPENADKFFSSLLITSDKPIVAQSGSQYTTVPNTSNLDGSGEQIMPAHYAGKEHIIARGNSTAYYGDYAIVTAIENGTDVFINGSSTPIATINAGGYVNIGISGTKGTPFFIETSENAYVYHVTGIVQSNVGMTQVPPIDKSYGTRKVNFKKDGIGANNAYIVIKTTDLSTLKLNGNAYTSFSPTITTVTGKSDYSLVYFGNTTFASSTYFSFEADEPFLLAWSIGDGIGKGWYNFMNGFEGAIEVLDPIYNLPASAYIVDTVETGSSTTHSLNIESAYPYAITNVAQGSGSVAFTDSTFTYTAPSNFCGLDNFKLTIVNDNGDRTEVCLSIFINDKPVAIDDNFNYLYTSNQILDVLNIGTPDSDPMSCDTIQLISAGINGQGNLSTLGATLAINNNGTPTVYSDDYIEYTPATGQVGTDTFYYIIQDTYGKLDTALVELNEAVEICGNGIDDDNDGLIDSYDPDCSDFTTISTNTNSNRYYLSSIWKDNNHSTPAYILISTSNAVTNISVSTKDGSFSIDTIAQAGIPLKIYTTVVQSQDINSTQADEGFIIDADGAIQAYYIIENGTNSAIATLKGEEALGYSFRVLTQTRSGINRTKDELHFASVMATQDGTTITFDNGSNQFYNIPSTTHTVTIDSGETYMVQPVDADVFFAGLLITADKPVAVNSGDQHTQTIGTSNRDGGIDQLLPIRLVGNEYIIGRGSSTANLADYAVVVATENNTAIFLNGSVSPVATINAGEYYEIDISGAVGTPYYIQTSKNAYLYHFSGQSEGEIGMAIVPPISPCIGN